MVGSNTMASKTLIILAAGIGSRFGEGVKQLTPVDDHGHLIIDYSIHNAIAAGFDKIVFIMPRPFFRILAAFSRTLFSRSNR